VTNPNEWIFVQSNVDAATEAVFGLVRFLAPIVNYAGFQAQVTNNPTHAINTARLNEALNIIFDEINSRGTAFLHNITTGENTIVHNLPNVGGVGNLIIQVTSSTGQTVLIDPYPHPTTPATHFRFHSLVSIPNCTFKLLRAV
jgi:hypothetical protein